MEVKRLDSLLRSALYASYSGVLLGFLWFNLTFTIHLRVSHGTLHSQSLSRPGELVPHLFLISASRSVKARFIATSEKALDVENRAFFMTMAMQLWASYVVCSRLGHDSNHFVVQLAKRPLGPPWQCPSPGDCTICSWLPQYRESVKDRCRIILHPLT